MLWMVVIIEMVLKRLPGWTPAGKKKEQKHACMAKTLVIVALFLHLICLSIFNQGHCL